jgi:hypothetical protein
VTRLGIMSTSTYCYSYVSNAVILPSNAVTLKSESHNLEEPPERATGVFTTLRRTRRTCCGRDIAVAGLSITEPHSLL